MPKLDARQRYLAGQPLTPQALLEALKTAPMRRRHALALELAFRSRGAIQVPRLRKCLQQCILGKYRQKLRGHGILANSHR